ncbi:MAG: hypothetical protein ACR2JO_03250 [Mycobacteriales bacterium]
MATSEKVRENRLRRMAARQGLSLSKSRRRDPRALDYGAWTVGTERVGKSWRGSELLVSDLDLDGVEAFLAGGAA